MDLIKRTIEFTRPADTTAYAANDAISDSTTAPTLWTNLNNILPQGGGSVILVRIRAQTNNTAWTGAIRAHLYSATPGANIADNAAFPQLFSLRASRVGMVLFSGWRTGGSGSDAAAMDDDVIRSVITLPGSSKDLWVRFSSDSAATPTSGQQFFFEFTFSQGPF